MTPCLVTIKKGVVDGILICQDGKHLEETFIQLNQDYGRETNSDEMDEGYVELEDVTICMCWAGTLYR